MRVGQRRVGIKEVAQRAGVSLSSVSRVLDGHPDVSEVMRFRVLDAVSALGYEPDPVAQSMRRGTTMTVGFVAGDTSNPLISQIGLAAELQLKKAGYSLLVANSMNDPDQERTNIKLLQTRRVDGLLLSVADESAPDLQDRVTASSAPIVLVDREVKSADVSAVNSDHAFGITKAAEHLFSLGHRHVALINGNPRVRPSRERAAALRKAFRGGSDVEVNVVNGSFSDTHGYESTVALLKRDDPPTAIVAGSNQILVGVLRAVRDLGRSVPGDVSIVTCDSSALAELYQPRISTISRNAAELGTVAAELLRDLMSGGAPERRLLPTFYEPADSCAPPTAASPTAASLKGSRQR